MDHDTDITEEKRAKRYSRHLGVATITGVVLSILIYHLQNYITPVINSHDICENDEVLGVSSWLFPRIVAHCNEILYTGIGNHKSADIAVIIDFFLGIFLVYMLSMNVAMLMHTTTYGYLKRLKRRWYRISSKNHATLMIISPFWLVLLFFICEGLYLGYPLLPEEDSHYMTRSMSILYSPIGFGAATQILVAAVVSSTPEYVYMFWILVKEDMAKSRGTS
ncbi:MAG: hypothetical protein OXE57_18945 [Alphaproteobacteria bacterium]|nr:hypothetical protein [Alphaproteobacteria bacterium]